MTSSMCYRVPLFPRYLSAGTRCSCLIPQFLTKVCLSLWRVSDGWWMGALARV